MAQPLSETFNRIGDHILRVDFKRDEGTCDDVWKYNGYTRMFNFLSRQVTTVHRDWLCEGRGSEAGGSSALSSHVIVESFDDLPSAGELKLMHAKLRELGGSPPALDDILPGAVGKTAKVRAGL
jgi:hypothetical protein